MPKELTSADQPPDSVHALSGCHPGGQGRAVGLVEPFSARPEQSGPEPIHRSNLGLLEPCVASTWLSITAGPAWMF